MFQFARTDIKEKIKMYQMEYDNEMKKSIDYEKFQKRIDKLLMLKNRIDHSKKKLCFFGVGAVLSLLFFGFGSLLEGITYILLASLMTSISFIVLELKTALEQSKYQKEVQTEYFDLICLNYEELKEKSKYFSECSFNSYHCAIEYRDLARSLESKLNHINHYEHVLKESENLLKDPYYLADSKSEYEKLINKEPVPSDIIFDGVMLEEYFNQSTDYSHVSFDNQISTPIDYTEKTKQLMKGYKKL